MGQTAVNEKEPVPIEIKEPVAMWSPLAEPIFRSIWLAGLFSNIGTWMQDVGAAWLMTSMTSSPDMVASMQTATYLPFFLLSLPAGAVADVFDRRKLLAIGQGWMLVAASILGVLTLTGMVSPWALLILTFMLGIGNAISAPAWNALTPELVAASKLEPAIALNGVSFNASRGIGAALGGLVVAAWGTASVFLINAASFLTIIFVLLRWKRVQEPNSNYQRESIFGAIRAGIRYVQHSPGLISVLARCCLFATCASAMWALLPLVGRQQLRLDSIGYGLLLSVFGVGTLMGAFLMPVFRRHMSIDHLNSAGNLLFAVSMVVLALSSNFGIASIAMLGCGVSWILVNSTLNVGAQMAVTAWVRARAMAVYILLFQGSVALGSFIWGQVALRYGLSVPLIAAGSIMCLNLICALKYKIGTTEGFDTTSSSHWSDPKIVHQPEPDDGPVLISVEYVIDSTKAKEFADACVLLGSQRRRDGAYQWHLFCDLAEPTRYLETFMVESWAEHVRQHERVIVSDRIAEQKVDSYHIGERPRKVRHMLSAYASEQPPGIPAIVESTSEA